MAFVPGDSAKNRPGAQPEDDEYIRRWNDGIGVTSAFDAARRITVNRIAGRWQCTAVWALPLGSPTCFQQPAICQCAPSRFVSALGSHGSATHSSVHQLCSRGLPIC